MSRTSDHKELLFRTFFKREGCQYKAAALKPPTWTANGRDSPMPRRSPEGTHSSCTWGCSDWPTSCPKEAYGTPLEVPHVQRHIGASAVKRVSIDEIVAQRYAHVVKGSPGGGLMLTDEGRKHLVSFPPFGRIVLTCPHTVR